MLAGWLLLEQEILMQTDPVVAWEPHSSDTSAGLAEEKLKSLPLLPAAVDSLVLGGSVQNAVAQLKLGSVAQLEVHN